MNIVKLTDNDLRVSAHVAFDRGLPSILQGLRNVNGGKDDPFLRHVYGAIGECAFAKFANIYWDGSVNRFNGMGQDVGDFQVRARSAKNLPMIIRPNDKDNDLFVLVQMVNGLREWNIAGYISGKRGKEIGKITPMQGGDRFLVSEVQLRDIKEIIK